MSKSFFFASANQPFCIFLPVPVILFHDCSLSITLRVANAAVGPIRSVQKVLLINVDCAASITDFLPTTAVSA